MFNRLNVCCFLVCGDGVVNLYLSVSTYCIVSCGSIDLWHIQVLIFLHSIACIDLSWINLYKPVVW